MLNAQIVELRHVAPVMALYCKKNITRAHAQNGKNLQSTAAFNRNVLASLTSGHPSRKTQEPYFFIMRPDVFCPGVLPTKKC